MAFYPYQYVNRRGSAYVESASVTVGTENVVFSFPNHAFASAWYQGTVFVSIAQEIPTGTTGTLPILFETNGVQQAITTYGGDALTVADLPGTGVYQFWFNRATGTLQLMTGAV